MFENVTYDFYSDTLGRSIVPSESDFERFRLENQLYIKTLYMDGVLEEKDENGIDSAICLMIEEDYLAEELKKGNESIASESISGYSYSVDTKASDLQKELDAKSTAQKKYRWLSLYCDIQGGLL